MNLETQAARDGLLENLEFRTKSPFASRLLIAEVAALGLKKWDKLLPCGDIVDIHGVDHITIFPASFFFPRTGKEKALSSICPLVTVAGLQAGIVGFHLGLIALDMLHTVDLGVTKHWLGVSFFIILESLVCIHV